ncbi:2-polyprenylphenol hydroxylase [Herbiconiux daphne]|uniref:2-polyprenylphenol hydroxylase n=1 Tax=Herbiconiux daphne TaxID=2970914 RepID=A0ABT2GZP5_9MICO|nr:2-polyprenylphenol hydroxylase [Herbiconiux daphne]MCS5733443.1 2-polyprenylphenol hydroxylase [Herbiconiux daphne]
MARGDHQHENDGERGHEGEHGGEHGHDGVTDAAVEAERWLVVNGRRWRRTDPSLPDDVVEALKSHLGRGRSAVGAAKRAAAAGPAAGDPGASGSRAADPGATDRGATDALAAARRRVGLAKRGLGERGPRWWERPEAERLAQAEAALAELQSLDD